jgi:hypothetical protein
VDARGLFGHVQGLADLPVRGTFGQQREHLSFPRSEAEDVALAGLAGYGSSAVGSISSAIRRRARDVEARATDESG